MSGYDIFSGRDDERSENKMQGVMVGIVTNNKDPEKLARVKIKLPIREGENETDWVRIATMMAGKDRGSLFIPEVGDEVLVAFHLGEISQPYVIGMLWNKENGSPKGDDKNNLRKLVSRAGSELTFDDTSGKEKVTLKSKKGYTLEFDDEKDTIKLQDKNGTNSVQIKAGSANDILIKSGETKIEINNKGDVTISSNKSMKLKSTQVDIEASATMNIKAGATLNLKSDGVVAIKGSIVKIN